MGLLFADKIMSLIELHPPKSWITRGEVYARVEAETMDLDQLALYLQRDSRELRKMANRGNLPGQKVAGEWRFARAEINFWLEKQLSQYSDEELVALERGRATLDDDGPLLARLLSEATIALPLAAGTRADPLGLLAHRRECPGRRQSRWPGRDRRPAG